MEKKQLMEVARSLVAPGKGILAADESFSTIEKRFKAFQIPSSEVTRRDYREMLLATPGLGQFISGVILFDETLRQKSADGRPLIELLKAQGIVPGIKVDKGAKALANFPGEKVTEGLDGLGDRLAEYAKLGARFTKWRAVITIGPDIPTRNCLQANAEALARFAALSQEAGLVPIVEPEVLMDGNHSIDRHFEVTEQTLQIVFDRLFAHRILLEGMLLKPNMVLSGKESAQQANVTDVAQATLNCLLHTVPAAVPGIIFLSGGQSDVKATEHLNALNQMGKTPWQLSFSYGRALQAPSLAAWRGDPRNVDAGQKALLHRARSNGDARFGKYAGEDHR